MQPRDAQFMQEYLKAKHTGEATPGRKVPGIIARLAFPSGAVVDHVESRQCLCPIVGDRVGAGDDLADVR